MLRTLASPLLCLSLAGCLSSSATPSPSADTPPTFTPTLRPSASSTADATRAPAWTATGDLVTPRSYHTTTLLADGRVLVAGGGSALIDPSGSASAELYDPGTGLWTTAGSMTEPRLSHTATLLADGRVLVAGGVSIHGVSMAASVLLYDPGSGKWTATASMAATRAGHTAMLLVDGRVLVVGGDDAGRSAEVYDPASGSWTATGNMVTPRPDHTATLLPDGMVLVVGGEDAGRSAELYDPGTGTWTATGVMIKDRRSGHTATLLPNGMVLVAGGDVGDGTFDGLASAELYDPVSRSWTDGGTMVAPRRDHTATLLPDGVVLVVGGGAAFAELYDP